MQTENYQQLYIKVIFAYMLIVKCITTKLMKGTVENYNGS